MEELRVVSLLLLRSIFSMSPGPLNASGCIRNADSDISDIKLPLKVKIHLVITSSMYTDI